MSLQSRLEDILEQAVFDGITPSAVCAVATGGAASPPVVVGDAVRFGADGAELPLADRAAASADTLYDLASVTKIFTAVAALTLVGDGVLGLDVPVAEWLPTYRDDASKVTVTLRQLLTHTAGLPPTWEGWRKPLRHTMAADGESTSANPLWDRSALIEDLLSTPLDTPPGASFAYSCVGYNTVMALAESVTSRPWPELVTARIIEPLGISGLTFAPLAESSAASEYQPEHGRGMIRGVVHDETAWALGGAAGNAGLFGSAAALLSFGERLREGLPGILSTSLHAEMWTDQLPRVLGEVTRGPGYGHGLGLRIGQKPWMGKQGAEARGHNGFTGTSLLMDRVHGVSVVLLTNRVHPNRRLSDITELRSSVSNTVYDAL